MIGPLLLERARSRDRLPLERAWPDALRVVGARLAILAAVLLLALAATPLILAAVWFVWLAGPFGLVVVLACLATLAAAALALYRTILETQRATDFARATVGELKGQQRQIARQAARIAAQATAGDELQRVVVGFGLLTEQLDRAGVALREAADRPNDLYERLLGLLGALDGAQQRYLQDAAQLNRDLAHQLGAIAARLDQQDQLIVQTLGRLEAGIAGAATEYARQTEAQASLIDESQRITAALAESTSRLTAAVAASPAPVEASARAQHAAVAPVSAARLAADLGDLHRLRYERRGESADLDAAIVLLRRALGEQPPG